MHDEHSLDRREHPITEEEMASLEKNPNLKEALENLQGNILRGHGRRHSVHLLLRFKADTKEDVLAVKKQIRSLAQGHLTQDGTAVTITSALQQRQQSENKEADPDTLFCSFFLSAAGYRYLDPKLIEGFSEEFRGGMRGAQSRLNDPPDHTWEEGYEHEFHAMILLACTNLQRLGQGAEAIRERFKDVIAHPAKEEWGNARPDGRTDQFIEHFGYLDGISQPLFFGKDVERAKQNGGIDEWDPSAGPRLVLIRDPGDKQMKNAYGSYLVFRKLAQDVPGFKDSVKKLADQLGRNIADTEVLIMGRYRNGTPIVRPNTRDNFALFSHDPSGAICPYQAHIRKANPRDDTARAREHRIARRGITYEAGGTEPREGGSPRAASNGEVGLLFMCYQSELKKQYEFIQSRLANNENFRQEKTGVDPIIGQGGQKTPQKWPRQQARGQQETIRPYAQQDDVREFFGGFVTLKGGEYFFAPSISFLKEL